MSDYIIMTDSSCDLPADLADKMELSVLPLYLDVDGQRYANYLDEREIAFSRLKHEGLEEIERLIVKSGDIDFVQHTNNVSYVRFIMNTYTVKELRENRVKAIEVRYAGQTHEGDELSIRKAVQDGKELFDVCLGDMVAVECEIERS